MPASSVEAIEGSVGFSHSLQGGQFIVVGFTQSLQRGLNRRGVLEPTAAAIPEI